MLNETLELNIAAKFYNKCQTDVNNHSNKCSGPNQMDRFTDKKETLATQNCDYSTLMMLNSNWSTSECLFSVII
jgi:hypothetical protein